MRVRTLEIRWHDSKPISTCDFQPMPFKKARPAHDKQFTTQAYRLATGGEDNHVRLWMIYPNIMPPSVLDGASVIGDVGIARPPRAEYLATLSRHSAAVNVVRFSPNGDLIASAGDDGMIIIWAPSAIPASSYGSDLSPEDAQYEREFWKPRITFRCTTMQVYDLAWSPTGEYILAGSTDNVARIFSASDGTCLKEIVEHSHYVQGVAWDPMNEYIATQSSDRSMHVHRVCVKGSSLEVHAVGKNTRMPHLHNRTPSLHSRNKHFRRESTAASDVESVTTTASEAMKEELSLSVGQQPLTPSTTASTPSTSMFPPPPVESSSRRSSFSGSNAPGSPSLVSRYGRSPSPMPALPAIRALPTTSAWASVKLYGDESYSNFFRRLTFSPDGGLLLTPAGQFEDPSVIPGLSDQSSRGRKRTTDESSATSSVYIYTRANFARPPIAQLPGHKKASVAVRFSPILYELRQGVVGFEEPATVVIEKGKEEHLDVSLSTGSAAATSTLPSSPHKHSIPTPTLSPIVSPSPAFPAKPSSLLMQSPALSATDVVASPVPGRSANSTPIQQVGTPSVVASSVFALPYRMLYAVATMDTIAIYDTQQAGPVCLLTKLHYDEFTDLAWSPDGQCLVMSARDGYCTIVVFDEIMTSHHTQQHTLQLQSIANHNSVPLIYSSTPAATPSSTPSIPSLTLPPVTMPAPITTVPTKRRPVDSPPPLTPVSSVDENSGVIQRSIKNVPQSSANTSTEGEGPPKKKRRAALTKVSELG